MEYKKILHWILLGFLMVNCDFTSNNIKVITREQAQAKYIANAQPQTGFWQRVKNFGKSEKVVSFGNTAGAITAAGLGLNFVHRYTSNPSRYDNKDLITKFLNDNKTFKIIYDDCLQDTKSPLGAKIVIPNCDQIDGEPTIETKSYMDLGFALNNIKDVIGGLDYVRIDTAKMVESFSKLSEKTKTTIKKQEIQIKEIIQYKDNINQCFEKIMEKNNEINNLEYLYDFIKEQYQKQSVDITKENQNLYLSSKDKILYKTEEDIKKKTTKKMKFVINEYFVNCIFNQMIDSSQLESFGFTKDQVIVRAIENKIGLNWENTFWSKNKNKISEYCYGELDLTDDKSVEKWEQDIEKGKKYLKYFSELCSDITDKNINNNIKKNGAVQKLLEKYFTNTDFYTFTDTAWYDSNIKLYVFKKK